jgi:nucleoside-diphosphate-sugar epimerase
MNGISVSILGCGWLGLPLAQRLVHLGYSVKGATTTPKKLSLLEESKITPFLLKADPQLNGKDIDLFFKSKILVLNIPFRRTLKDPEYYQQQIDSVIQQVESSPIEFLIFASSTSVYPASLKSASEDISFVADHPRSKVLQAIERALLTHPNFRTTIIRFSGLYGGKRKIGTVLAGRSGLTEGNAPVNLIHLEDCVEIVAQVIQKDIRGEIFNACSDGHPTRKEIYTKSALFYGLKPPQFNDQPQTRFKIVPNTKLKKQLGYTFIHPDPMVFDPSKL